MSIEAKRKELKNKEKQLKRMQSYIEIIAQSKSGDFNGLNRLLEQDKKNTQENLSNLNPASKEFAYAYAEMQGILKYIMALQLALQDPEKRAEILATEIQGLVKEIQDAEQCGKRSFL